MDITRVKGVGPERAALLARLGVRSVEDLLWHLPRRYEDLRPWDGASEGAYVVSGALGRPKLLPGRRVEATLQTAWGEVTLLFYGKPYLARTLRRGARETVFGKLARRGPTFRMDDPERLPSDAGPSVRPVYPLTEGLTQGVFRRIVAGALPSPASGGLEAAFRRVHAPKTLGDAAEGMEALKAWEARAIATKVARATVPVAGRPFPPVDPAPLAGHLPFAVRPDQWRALGEISRDLENPRAMRRILFGDVGTGKTLVALLAAHQVLQGGWSVLLLCPTSLLLDQHLATARQVLGSLFPVAAVGGGRPKGRALPVGPVLVVGTTAVLDMPSLKARLGLVIVDEEQRFGVKQREALLGGSPSPHLLTLSATPIPRSLAHALAGNLSVSSLAPREGSLAEVEIAPPSRRRRAYLHALRACREGGQAIIVCPRIREGYAQRTPPAEGLAEALRQAYPSVPVTLVTGETDGADLEAALRPFREGRPGFLVGTSVLEVGLDLPGARVLVVEGAASFGLSQLHQMRGRVGRRGGAAKAYWIADGEDPRAAERLAAAARARRGEDVALLDLEVRGPGLLEGWLQHGFPPLRALTLPEDLPLLTRALVERAGGRGTP